jgi:hypothetical protein
MAQEPDIKTLLKPCVARDELLNGDVATLRQRLAAILHFTGLHEQYPVDLHDKYALESLHRSLLKPFTISSDSLLQHDGIRGSVAVHVSVC